MNKIKLHSTNYNIFFNYLLKKIFKKNQNSLANKDIYDDRHGYYISIEENENNIVEIYKNKDDVGVNQDAFQRKNRIDAFPSKDVISIKKKFYFDFIQVLRLVGSFIILNILGSLGIGKIFQIIPILGPILGLIIILIIISGFIIEFIDIFKYKYEIVLSNRSINRITLLCNDINGQKDFELFFQNIILKNKKESI